MRRNVITLLAATALTTLAAGGIAHADPATQLHEGQQVVGQDVQPGTYRTDGPRDQDYGSCFITWLPDKGAKSSELIDIESYTGASFVHLNAGDVVDVSGCSWGLE
ncbi:hypothetical protein OHB26_38490 [Nocardia sp. NBC_01503]|uniref:hypothetical protein n=1 Tax=Nocardia sp. NBC_01503 TaxID=2975997 RepID=UPI002E7BB8E1|nr:hypothetical protein [Nocardia sp. NBC_01503]WTL32668.1 hypothetical protein OHB26_38490 [Nocardia sp. NBC_01503]